MARLARTGCRGSIVTDGAWKFALAEEDGFAALHHDDRAWERVMVLLPVKRGTSVWGCPTKGRVPKEGR